MSTFKRTNYKGGLPSGAPILTLVESEGLYSWRLGGVIVEAHGKSESCSSTEQEPMKLVKASLADCIRADGVVNRFPNNEMYNKS